ncbi:hypothetical protein KRMM14A1004_37710 [Krasilnikovia sp. MM14-A1004]
MRWLRDDLARNGRRCVAAYWHHPLFISGDHGNNPVSRPAREALQAAGADLVLTGHDHDYERFAPQRADGRGDAGGIAEFVVGTGGASNRPLVAERPHSVVRMTNVHGVLKLTLNDTAYIWEFVSVDGKVRDRGSATCH